VASAERPALPHRGLRGPPAGSGRGQRPQLASRQIVPAGAQVQVHPAAVPLDLVVILGRAVRRCPEQRCCFTDGVCDVVGWRPRGSTPGLANRYQRQLTTSTAVAKEPATSCGSAPVAATVPALAGLPGPPSRVSLPVRPGAVGRRPVSRRRRRHREAGALPTPLPLGSRGDHRVDH
jgi:hypothetical protein